MHGASICDWHRAVLPRRKRGRRGSVKDTRGAGPSAVDRSVRGFHANVTVVVPCRCTGSRADPGRAHPRTSRMQQGRSCGSACCAEAGRRGARLARTKRPSTVTSGARRHITPRARGGAPHQRWAAQAPTRAPHFHTSGLTRRGRRPHAHGHGECRATGSGEVRRWIRAFHVNPRNA